MESRPENCPTVYGPVQSRRHGLSLGINLGLVETKVCTWGCVYCQCGMGERREILPAERTQDAQSILSQVRESVLKNPGLDSITFAGNSEPTSHPEFHKIVVGLLDLRKTLGEKWIINCLSNGSELERADVIQTCEMLDETWVKLDCALDPLFKRLNRPLARVGGVASHVARIAQLKQVHLQTLMWTCSSNLKLANWTPENQEALLDVYRQLKPARIHLTTIARTPAVSELGPVPEVELYQFAIKVSKQGIQVDVFG